MWHLRTSMRCGRLCKGHFRGLCVFALPWLVVRCASLPLSLRVRGQIACRVCRQLSVCSSRIWVRKHTSSPSIDAMPGWTGLARPGRVAESTSGRSSAQAAQTPDRCWRPYSPLGAVAWNSAPDM